MNILIIMPSIFGCQRFLIIPSKLCKSILQYTYWEFKVCQISAFFKKCENTVEVEISAGKDAMEHAPTVLSAQPRNWSLVLFIIARVLSGCVCRRRFQTISYVSLIVMKSLI